MRFAQLLALSLVGVATGVSAAPADPAFGLWLTAARDGQIRIAPCPERPAEACGIIAAPYGTQTRSEYDDKNPNPALRTRPLIGLRILSGFRSEGAGRWTGGKIYDPTDGRTYSAYFSVRPDGQLKLNGCVLVFCTSQIWPRLD